MRQCLNLLTAAAKQCEQEDVPRLLRGYCEIPPNLNQCLENKKVQVRNGAIVPGYLGDDGYHLGKTILDEPPEYVQGVTAYGPMEWYTSTDRWVRDKPIDFKTQLQVELASRDDGGDYSTLQSNVEALRKSFQNYGPRNQTQRNLDWIIDQQKDTIEFGTGPDRVRLLLSLDAKRTEKLQMELKRALDALGDCADIQPLVYIQDKLEIPRMPFGSMMDCDWPQPCFTDAQNWRKLVAQINERHQYPWHRDTYLIQIREDLESETAMLFRYSKPQRVPVVLIRKVPGQSQDSYEAPANLKKQAKEHPKQPLSKKVLRLNKELQELAASLIDKKIVNRFPFLHFVVQQIKNDSWLEPHLVLHCGRPVLIILQPYFDLKHLENNVSKLRQILAATSRVNYPSKDKRLWLPDSWK